MLSTHPQDPAIVAGFYEAAALSRGWSGAWAALCAAFDAETGLLYRRSRPAAPPVILASGNWPRASHGVPREGGPRIDPDTLDAALKDAAAPAASAGRHRPDLLCASASLEGTATIGMGLRRPAGHTLFTEADRRSLDGMGRHVAAALRLEALLAAERLSSALRGAAMDVSPHGIVLLGAAGTILFANAAARRIAAEEGALLGRGAGGPGGICPHEAARLESLVDSAGGGGPGGSMRISRRSRRAPLAAIIEPLPADIAEANALPAGQYVLMTLRDLGATADAPPAYLMDLFGLTPAEAGIVPQLLCGDSASLIAQSRGVAVSTVKAQAARVLTKTGAANLRALSMMIAALGCG